MEQEELLRLLSCLIDHWENEVVEFKNVGSSYSTSDIGKYFSALSNEANLRNAEKAWLVFGVDNNSRTIVGSNYRTDSAHLQSLKMQISDDTEPGVTFREIHELHSEKGRVILFEIPAAPLGIPVAWKGHYYARAGESLTHLGLDKLDEIRGQAGLSDWSGQIVPAATVDHLDPEALSKAKDSFAKKYANRFPREEIMSWPDITFLDRAKQTKDGQMTRATILLLGKAEAAHLLSPYPAQMTWKLEGPERAYEHFGPPFLINTTGLYRKIRNIQLRILPEDELLPIEVAKYDQKIVLEALHNCIAHQDYTRSGRIVVTELSDRLIFENEGDFYEGCPEDYISGNKTPRRYRNPFLAQAMADLNMIDTMGYGIHEMHIGQAQRYFPLPDYDLRASQAVKMTIYGKVVDPAYSRILIRETDLPIQDILALDRVQKKLPIGDAVAKHLRQAKLIEGKKPNYHVSAAVAAATDSKVSYIRTRAQDNDYYIKLIYDFLVKFGSATRREIDNLLWDKLSDALDDRQRRVKISNLIATMRDTEKIVNKGSRKSPIWVLKN